MSYTHRCTVRRDPTDPTIAGPSHTDEVIDVTTWSATCQAPGCVTIPMPSWPTAVHIALSHAETFAVDTQPQPAHEAVQTSMNRRAA